MKNSSIVKNSIKKLSVLLFTLLICACTSLGQPPSTARTVSSLAPFANDIADQAVMGKWARSCALCHVSGEAGAPLAGDSAEWQRRLAQGEASILRRVLEGYNSMPPLGYCMACEVDDFRAMIGFMAGTSQ